MALTAAQARDDLLGLIGIEDPSHASPPVLARILSDVNKTLREMYSKVSGLVGGPFAVIGDLDSDDIEVPDAYIETVFLPVLRGNFATWKNVDADSRKMLFEDREAAWATLKEQINQDEASGTAELDNTIDRAALDVLGLMGISSIAAASLPLKRRILSDIQSTLEELWTVTSAWGSTDTARENIMAPTTVSLAFNTDSRTFGGTLETWMIGCTMRIPGQPFETQITSATTMLDKWRGGGTTATCTVYHDAITLADASAGVLPPVVILGERELAPLRGPRDVRTYAQSGSHYGGNNLGGEFIGDNRDIDVPTAYYVERAVADNRVILRIRLAPLPDRAYVLEFQNRLESPRITDFGDASLRVPQNYVDSIFIPILRHKFFGWPDFKTSGNTQWIRDARDEALQKLSKLKPQVVRIGRIKLAPNW